MQRAVVILLSLVCVVLGYFTFVSAGKAFDTDWHLPDQSGEADTSYRLVLITLELDTPFWDMVGAGAMNQAKEKGVSLEVWGSYGKDQDEFLRLIELAIYSKVDGIIAQGLDTEEFSNLTAIKAASYGIPILTVANDVPMHESLRRTYVGTDQYEAGKLIAKQLLHDMGTAGKVILMSDNYQEYYQEQRLNGILEVLQAYPEVQPVLAETPDSREQVIEVTRGLMNEVPDANAFIALNANVTGAMLQEIGRRSQIEPYYIYSFDDGADSLTLLQEGKIDGVIQQAPTEMGRLSVDLLVQWLTGETIPLDDKGYMTPVRLLRARDVK